MKPPPALPGRAAESVLDAFHGAGGHHDTGADGKEKDFVEPIHLLRLQSPGRTIPPHQLDRPSTRRLEAQAGIKYGGRGAGLNWSRMAEKGHNSLFKVRAQRRQGDQTEEQVFIFREFGVKAFLRKMERLFPEWEVIGEPEESEPTVPDTKPERLPPGAK